ncbi:hypothetical protein SAMN05421805_11128 [Saccharopolyspora antimicrobica]|uniref:Uncharacterized protein n=2 Tax=Pseudonocardiaceae TaxID=2070 RepID=A0A1I5FFD6_9PSEU|nr:hypothetical protein ATL45_0356 [Saccharopolyspora antimicrobica]SFO22379.1 hypothetical protein SAMN05421805_11128 [Saccharopolyspora antimicrobica]
MNRKQRRKNIKPMKWLDNLKESNPEMYQEAIDLVAEGLITFDSNGRMVGADGRTFDLVEREK